MQSPAPGSARRPARASTIKDVAAHAGVSITTVSHALNNKGTVSERTKQKVLESAAALGYRANAIARGLRTNRTGVISLVMRPLDWLGEYQPVGVDYFMRLVGAAAVSALDEGFTLLLVRDPTREGNQSITLAVDGCIIADPEAGDPVIDVMRERGIPIVSIGRDVARDDFTDWIGDPGTDQANQILGLMRDTGARRFLTVIGTQTNAWNKDSLLACLAWAEANPDCELAIERLSESEGFEGGVRFGQALAAQATEGRPLPDAIYALTGRHAAGIVDGLVRAGVDVPGRVQVASGNDSEQCRASVPTVTAVNLRPEVLGREAVLLLLNRIEGGSEPAKLVAPIFLERESTRRAEHGQP